jgi:dTDP-4-amino-4,6-dideoxygalactose transaminase
VQRIPFNKVYVTGRETELMADAIRRGRLSGDGHYTEQATALLRGVSGGAAVLLTTSCTHALELTAMLLNLEPGDEVIMPSFTFVSTANAYALRGARPVFVDIKRGTNNIDETLIERAISDRTKAVVVMHYGGVACEMDEIMRIATTHQLSVIEDNAHGFGGTYRSQPLGSIGSMSTLSFHETKNVQCGEGGAVVLNDASLATRAEVLREKGTNRAQFHRGDVEKYTWLDIGSSYLPSELLAAFLTAQLDEIDVIQSKRRTVWKHYASALADWADQQGFALPEVAPHVAHPAHIFWMLAPDHETRGRFIAFLDAAGITAVFHYVPLHSSPMGRRFAPEQRLPITQDVSERLVRLPLYAGLGESDLQRVLDAVLGFRTAGR